MLQVERGFVPVGEGQMHYRRVGSGPAVVLLHPSPQSSTFSMPFAQQLAGNFTAIALDTPGYGLSDPLPGNPRAPELTDYLPALLGFLDAMGLQKVALYGNATGAEIAHLFAHAHPGRVALCMIDTAGHRADAELDRTLDGYFPDVQPRRDGGHLQTHWDMVRSLYVFSPWQKLGAAQRLAVDMPPAEVLQSKLLDYLAAGANYAAAYRPAFYTAKHELIRRITVPTTLTRWEGKPDLTEVDDLIARGLPANFTILRAGPTIAERFAVAEQHLLQHYRPIAPAAPPAPPQLAVAASRWQREFAERDRQWLLRRSPTGQGPVLLALHDALESSRQFLHVLAGLVGRRRIVAPDLPGCGDSAPAADAGGEGIEAHARSVLALLDDLGELQVDVLGWGRGGQVAIEIARLAPARVRRLLLLGPLPLDAARLGLEEALDETSLRPRWDGAHLATAWSIVRDAELYFPWSERTRRGALRRDVEMDADELDRRVQDLLKLGERWQALLRGSLEHPTTARFAGIQCDVAVADRVGNDATEAWQAALLAANRNARMLELPPRRSEWSAAVADYFA